MKDEERIESKLMRKRSSQRVKRKRVEKQIYRQREKENGKKRKICKVHISQ